MNQIITMDLAELQAKATERAERCRNLAIAPTNARSFDSLRTENNKFIKDTEKALDGARKEFLRPFDEMAGKYLGALEPLREANKVLSNEILSARKEAFRNDMYEAWQGIATANGNGEVTPFDEAFDPSWYGKTKAEANRLLSEAMRKARLRKKRGVHTYTLVATEDRFEELEQFMDTHCIAYERE